MWAYSMGLEMRATALALVYDMRFDCRLSKTLLSKVLVMCVNSGCDKYNKRWDRKGISGG